MTVNDQSLVSNMTRFVRDINEFIPNVHAVRDADDFIADAKPSSLSVFRDPLVNESVEQESETSREVRKGVPRKRPSKIQQQSHLQRCVQC
jgi:hypothetical protein